MINDISNMSFLRDLVLKDVLLVLTILIVARLMVHGVRWIIRQIAENGPPSMRQTILGLAPKARLLIEIASILIILPILVEPTFQNTVALIASAGLALAFAFKDYGSCLIAGLVTILENTYQPGDWIEIDGIYGEVKSIGTRAVHIVTADNNEVAIPHSVLWSRSISNSTSGNQGLLCVAHFYLHPDHDGAAAQRQLLEIANSSPYIKPETKVQVIVMEKPWGTLYRLKAYVKESREQFLFITDLTVRGKEMLRNRNIRFAQVPYAQTGSS